MNGRLTLAKGWRRGLNRVGRGARVCNVIALSILIIATGLSSAAFGQLLEPPECLFFSEPQHYNTQTRGNVIVIGNQPDRSYRVILVGDDATVLATIRSCVLDAFVTQSSQGSYIQVGSFARRSEAEALQRILRREGYHARTIYVR